MNNVGLSLRQAVRLNADGIASRTLTADGESIATEMSWAEMEKEVASLSEVLAHWPALKPGDRLGVLGSNSAEYLQLMYACADAGIIFVPLNTRWGVDELRHAVVDSGIKTLAVLESDFVSRVLEVSAVAPAALGLSWLLVGPLASQFPEDPAARSQVSQWRKFPVAGVHRKEDVFNVEGWREVDDARGDLMHAAFDGHDSVGILDGASCHRSLHGADRAGREADDTRDIFCIVHTSGSTGRSKGVALTHMGQIFQAFAKCVHLGYTSSTTYLNVLPFFHVGGISSALAVTLAGGCHVFVPKFAPACGSAAVPTGRVNSIVMVPTMLHMLIKGSTSAPSVSDKRRSPLEAVHTVVVGGQPMPRRLERMARDNMPEARFVQTYACTEAGSTITFARSLIGVRRGESGGESRHVSDGRLGATSAAAEEAYALWATAGSPADHVEIRVVERSSDHNLPACLAAAGAVGEVETRGPHVMKGYWKRPDLTAEVLRPDGWLRTGDLGRLDTAGQLVVVGRAKDVIKTGGEKVHSSEVEGVLLRHAWVAEAAAYGVDDERLGEKVAASVVLADAAQDEKGAVTCDRAKIVLDRFCGLHLSHYKRPRQIDVVPALPRNSAGKVLRHMLRASL